MNSRFKPSMRGLIFLISCLFAVAFGFSTAAAVTTKKLDHGQVFIQQISGVTFHTYFAAGMVSHIVETPNAVVLQDTVTNIDHNKELKAYIETLDKVLDRVIVSHDHEHHWLGLPVFKGVPIYATAETIQSIRENGKQMLEAARKQSGEEAVPYSNVVIPSYFINPGEERIDGVLFRYVKPEPPFVSNVLWIEFPEQNALMHHHLAYLGMHFPAPPLQARIQLLKGMKQDGYQWLMGGHGMPAGPEFFDITVDYFQTVQRVVNQSDNVKMAKEKMMAAYPNWGGDFLLNMMLPAYFQNK